MCGLDDVDRLLCLRFLPPLFGGQHRERALEWRPVEEAVGHGRPRGSDDQTGPEVDPPVPLRGCSMSDTRMAIEFTGVQRHGKRTCLSLSTVYYSLFGGDSVLESLVNIGLDTSLSLLLFRTVSGDDLLGLGEVGSNSLWIPEPSGMHKTRAIRQPHLEREIIQGSSLYCVDCELVIRMNGSETSRNLVQKY